MKKAEEILMKHTKEYFAMNTNLFTAKNDILKAMDEFAQLQVNNLDKANVIKCDGDGRKALLIDFISWYLNVFMRDKKLTKTKTPIQSIDIFLKSINSL